MNKKLKLVKPKIEHKKMVMEYRKTFIENNESLAGASSLEKVNTYEEWLDILNKLSNEDTLPKGYVPSTTFLAMDNLSQLVGIVELRHHINHPILSTWGGHIGYSVHPNMRRKGYGSEMLRLVLKEARKMKISQLMVTADANNIASQKIIIANDGIFDQTYNNDGEIVYRYLITIK